MLQGQTNRHSNKTFRIIFLVVISVAVGACGVEVMLSDWMNVGDFAKKCDKAAEISAFSAENSSDHHDNCAKVSCLDKQCCNKTSQLSAAQIQYQTHKTALPIRDPESRSG